MQKILVSYEIPSRKDCREKATVVSKGKSVLGHQGKKIVFEEV